MTTTLYRALNIVGVSSPLPVPDTPPPALPTLPAPPPPPPAVPALNQATGADYLSDAEKQIINQLGIAPEEYREARTQAPGNALDPTARATNRAAADDLSDAEREVCQRLNLDPADFRAARK